MPSSVFVNKIKKVSDCEKGEKEDNLFKQGQYKLSLITIHKRLETGDFST